MYNLEQNIITGAIDDYTQEYNPISRTEFISVSEDWSVTDKYVISKTIESDDSVVVGFNVIEPLAYKKVTGVCVSFKSTGDVQSVGIGNTNLFKYCNKDTTDERPPFKSEEVRTIDEIERGTDDKYMFVKTDHEDNISDENIKGLVHNYDVGDDQYLFDWSSDELKDILFNQGVFVRITYTPINTNVIEDENFNETSDSDEIEISDLTLKIYFGNELQDEIDIIENRLECINLQEVIDTQGILGYKYIYSTTIPSTSYIGNWSDTPLTPSSTNPIVYYISFNVDSKTGDYYNVSVPEIYAEYNEDENVIYYYEYIYKVNNNPSTPLCPTLSPSTGVAPTGWSVIYEATSDKFPYGWKCYRSRVTNGVWSKYMGVKDKDNNDVAIAYTNSEQVDANALPYQYCYILVGENENPPILEYYLSSNEFNEQEKKVTSEYRSAIIEEYGELPDPSFSFKRPSVSKDYPYLYAFKRERISGEWSLWRGTGGMYRKFIKNEEVYYYLRYMAILIDNFEHNGEEDTIQYSYRLGANGNYTWREESEEEPERESDYNDEDTKTTPNQNENHLPDGWASIIDYQSSPNSYPYRLKRTKHLGRWSMWNGEKEVYYG